MKLFLFWKIVQKKNKMGVKFVLIYSQYDDQLPQKN